MAKRYTVTSALPYTNGPVHIGHLAGVYVPADIYVRYLRSNKKDVAFICGSDEHGVPITIRAQKEGITPQQVVDKYHEIIKKSFHDFGISFDIYSRTSSETHKETASDFFEKLYNDKKFIEKVSEQFYDEKNNQFLADRYIKGTCPKCGNEEAYGDQCEKCGSTLSSEELINPKSALTGETPVVKETSHWYLPLNEYEDWLKKWILEDHKEWKKNVYGQCKSWLESGLHPRAVTRDLDWGVPVPVEGAEGKVLYVWFDAPIGYISATKDWASANGKNWEDYWKDSETELVHFIGKDNIVFHCVIFPSMLKAHGEYILPENVPANEFLNLEGDKISTSRNWAVWLHEFLEDMPEKQDVLRYTLCSNAPEAKDNDFTWKDFQTKNNSELVNNLGNFIHRVLTLTNKYFKGVVPSINGDLTEDDKDALEAISVAPLNISESIKEYKFRDALEHLMTLSRSGNKYLADTEPWKLWKTNPERVETILKVSLDIVANLSILMEPFLPFSAKKLSGIINKDGLCWGDSGKTDLLSTGHQINASSHLFTQIEDSTIEYQVQKLEDSKAKNNSENQKQNIKTKPMISFEDFTKLDLRVGTITEAEKVPKTNKLLKLSVDIGFETRTVVSGIAGSYDPENVVGKQVTLLINLEPRKIKGIESQGMILMAADQDDNLMFVNPDEEFVNGSEIG